MNSPQLCAPLPTLESQQGLARHRQLRQQMGPRCPLLGWVARPTEARWYLRWEGRAGSCRLGCQPPNYRLATHLSPGAGKSG